MLSTTAILIPMVVAVIERRALNDPVAKYLGSVRLPIYSNSSRRQELQLTLSELIPSLTNSLFPCEQAIYIQSICTANGTEEGNFLAEQQCLCNGSYWEVSAGCNDCYLTHGYQNYTAEEASSRLSSLSAAECTPSPPYQPFSNLQ